MQTENEIALARQFDKLNREKKVERRIEDLHEYFQQNRFNSRIVMIPTEKSFSIFSFRDCNFMNSKNKNKKKRKPNNVFKSIEEVKDYYVKRSDIEYSQYYLSGFNLITDFKEIKDENQILYLYSDQILKQALADEESSSSDSDDNSEEKIKIVEDEK